MIVIFRLEYLAVGHRGSFKECSRQEEEHEKVYVHRTESQGWQEGVVSKY